MTLAIRPYHPSDLTALYRICVRTADAGGDASALFRDHDLPGHQFVTPHVSHDPAHAYVLTRNGVPAGYLVGVRDLTSLIDYVENHYLPVLRVRYPLLAADDDSRDANAIRGIHAPHVIYPERAQYGGNLHINLLPEAQGKGWGARLIDTFLASLRAHGVKGASLGVNTANTRAIAFYEKYGFHRIPAERSSIGYGIWL
jgi:ribosomal protein S18 acetylase RimI-like enzyme